MDGAELAHRDIFSTPDGSELARTAGFRSWQGNREGFRKPQTQIPNETGFFARCGCRARQCWRGLMPGGLRGGWVPVTFDAWKRRLFLPGG